MIPDHLIGTMRAISPADAIAAIRRRLDDGGEAGDLATSDVRALLAAHDAGERAARAAAWALSQAEATVAVLRGRFEASQAAHDSLCDALVAVSRGEAPGAIDGCVIAADALRAIAAERERLRTVATAARAYLAADLDVTDAYDEVARTDALRALTASLDDEVTR